jgi:hypothetical protein
MFDDCFNYAVYDLSAVHLTRMWSPAVTTKIWRSTWGGLRSLVVCTRAYHLVRITHLDNQVAPRYKIEILRRVSQVQVKVAWVRHVYAF